MRRLTWIGLAAASIFAAGCGGDGDGGGEDGGTGECGNGQVEAGEDCDDGNGVQGDGCEPDCTFTCASDDDCDDGNFCNGTETCNMTNHRCQLGTPPGDGAECQVQVVVDANPDGGTPDGGLPDGGASMTVLEDGLCLDEQCGLFCENDGECDDGNACTGTETCDPEMGVCAPGTPPDCDDGEVCTDDSCDPEMGCVHVVNNDADEDGFADESVTCDDPSYGGDCNDDDDEVYPGAEELCDGKDNDCDTDVDETIPTWYVDCDGDGYAANTNGSREACNEPDPQGGCGWTKTRPTGTGDTDCDDTASRAFPGQNEWFERPYCTGTDFQASGSYPSWSCSSGFYTWDYDCDGDWDRRWTATEVSGCQEHTFCFRGFCNSFCSTEGWTGTSAPTCGASGELRSCGYSGGSCDDCLLFCIIGQPCPDCYGCTCSKTQQCH